MPGDADSEGEFHRVQMSHLSGLKPPPGLSLLPCQGLIALKNAEFLVCLSPFSSYLRSQVSPPKRTHRTQARRPLLPPEPESPWLEVGG